MNEIANFNKRRRVLRLAAYSTAALMTPSALWASTNSAQIYSWYGRALGAETSIQLYHHQKEEAENILKEAVAIIRKYEAIFSLFDDNSEVARLNKAGKLDRPSAEFIKLITISQNFSHQTDGAFDISIQPLWNLYKNHFSNNNQLDLNEQISHVIGSVGWQNISVDHGKIAFKKPTMSVSFNGIAQGYITDKVTEFLSSQGFDHTLVDIGEYRAGGTQANGEPWQIGLLDPFDQVSIASVMPISKGALATSGGYGDMFDGTGKYHHIFNAKTGLSSDLYASVSVKAADATTADALSTAFSNMSLKQIENVIGHYNDVEVRLTLNDGERLKLKSS